MENSLEVSNKWEPLNKTSYNGLAALIYIMPMIVETLKKTAKKKEKRIECIVDVILQLQQSRYIRFTKHFKLLFCIEGRNNYEHDYGFNNCSNRHWWRFYLRNMVHKRR